jgi:hypothetical protein
MGITQLETDPTLPIALRSIYRIHFSMQPRVARQPSASSTRSRHFIRIHSIVLTVRSTFYVLPILGLPENDSYNIIWNLNR